MSQFATLGENATNMRYFTGEGTRLVLLPNCNADERCKAWLGALNGQTNIGCGINVLRFMGEIDEPNAQHGLVQAMGGQGTPFTDVVNWFNKKINKFGNNNTVIQEVILNIDSKENLTAYFNILIQNLTLNSCTIVKLNRNSDPRYRPANTTPGHYVLMTKDSNGDILTYEPIFSGPSKCDSRKYKGVSDNFVNTYKTQGYITASLLGIIPKIRPQIPLKKKPIYQYQYQNTNDEGKMDIVEETPPTLQPTLQLNTNSDGSMIIDGGGYDEEQNIFLMPDDTLSELAKDIDASVVCKNPNSGGKTRKKRRNSRKKNKTNKKKTSKKKTNKKKTNKKKQH